MFKQNPFAKKMGPQKMKYNFDAPVQEPPQTGTFNIFNF
jgi:hypothetical protein